MVSGRSSTTSCPHSCHKDIMIFSSMKSKREVGCNKDIILAINVA